MKKLNIFFYITYQDGTGYYRMHKPAEMINKLGLANVITNPFNAYKPIKEAKEWYNFTPEKNGELACANRVNKVFKKDIDAVVIQRMDTPQMLSMALAIKEQYKVPIIQETDDYVWDVPPTNPGVMDYHEKQQGIFTPAEDPMMIARKSLGVFDGYIVTTPFLKKFYENYSPTSICPNSLDVKIRKPKAYKNHKDIRIMFSSSAGHFDNLQILKEPIKKILEKYPTATFYQYSFLPNLMEGTKYAKRVKKMKYVHPDKYWEYINSLSPDICLAPLLDSLYNRAKSNLRILEYWTAGNNLVIASPIGHYKETIIDGKNGLFAGKGEWFEKIDYAIKHPELRNKLGKEGRKTAEDKFNLEKNARLWIDSVKSAISNYDSDKQAPDQYISPLLR